MASLNILTIFRLEESNNYFICQIDRQIDSFCSNIKERRSSLKKNKKIEWLPEDDRKAEEREKTYQLIWAFVYTATQLVFQLSLMGKQNTFSIDILSDVAK